MGTPSSISCVVVVDHERSYNLHVVPMLKADNVQVKVGFRVILDALVSGTQAASTLVIRSRNKLNIMII